MPVKFPWIFPGGQWNIQGNLAGAYATSKCVIKFNGLLGTADIGVHVVHISRRDATSQCHGCSGPDDARGLCFNSLVIDHFSSLSTRSAFWLTHNLPLANGQVEVGQMETFSASLVLCTGNSPVTGEFPSQRPITRSFDAFFALHVNKRLSTQSRCLWFETPSHSFWRHCGDAFSPV